MIHENKVELINLILDYSFQYMKCFTVLRLSLRYFELVWGKMLRFRILPSKIGKHFENHSIKEWAQNAFFCLLYWQ
jgi:hypothetical protein